MYKDIDTYSENAPSPHLENIKTAAKTFGIELKEPNPSCKHCNGRGYVGVYENNGEPIPCRCIMPKMDRRSKLVWESRRKIPVNRKQRRSWL